MAARVALRVHDASLLPRFHLTWQHRAAMLAAIDDHDAFAYTEDDLAVSLPGLASYLSAFPALWARGVVPTLLRVETRSRGSTLFSTDNIDAVGLFPSQLVVLPENARAPHPRVWARLSADYCGLWAAPAPILREFLRPKTPPPFHNATPPPPAAAAAAASAAAAAAALAFVTPPAELQPDGWPVREEAASWTTVGTGRPGVVPLSLEAARKVAPMWLNVHPDAFVRHSPNTYARDARNPGGKLPSPRVARLLPYPAGTRLRLRRVPHAAEGHQGEGLRGGGCGGCDGGTQALPACVASCAAQLLLSRPRGGVASALTRRWTVEHDAESVNASAGATFLSDAQHNAGGGVGGCDCANALRGASAALRSGGVGAWDVRLPHPPPPSPAAAAAHPPASRAAPSATLVGLGDAFKMAFNAPAAGYSAGLRGCEGSCAWTYKLCVAATDGAAALDHTRPPRRLTSLLWWGAPRAWWWRSSAAAARAAAAPARAAAGAAVAAVAALAGAAACRARGRRLAGRGRPGAGGRAQPAGARRDSRPTVDRRGTNV